MGSNDGPGQTSSKAAAAIASAKEAWALMQRGSDCPNKKMTESESVFSGLGNSQGQQKI